MSYTLVVVDMQWHFYASRSARVRNNCLREIKRAIKNKAGIVILEYEQSGKTLPSIRKAVAGYSKSFFVTKEDDDGSNEVLTALKKYKLPRTLKVVGVNTDCCVYSTVAPLSRKHKISITVIADACNSDGGIESHKAGLADMRALPKVKIKRS